jgi:hypothetical protein
MGRREAEVKQWLEQFGVRRTDALAARARLDDGVQKP